MHRGVGYDFVDGPSGLVVPSTADITHDGQPVKQVAFELVGPGDTTKFLRGDATPTWAAPTATPSGSAGGDIAGTGASTYPNPTLTAIGAATGPIGSTSVIPVVTIDTKGRVTALSSASPQIDTIGAGTDITTNDVSTTKHGLAPKAPNDATKFLDGTGAYDTVKDSDLSTSNITTNDVTTAKHGFVPIAPNDPAKFLRGDGSWATVGGSGGGVVGNDAIWDTKGDLAAATGPDAAVKVAAGANGTVLTADSTQAAGIKWAAPAVTLLYDFTIAGSDQASIDTFVDGAGAGALAAGGVLEAFIIARTDDVAATAAIDVTVNNDTGGNYDRQVLSGANATAAASMAVAQTKWALNVHGSGGTAGYATSYRLMIPGYAATAFNKTGELLGALSDGTAGNNSMVSYGIGWRSTAAITRIKVAAEGTAKLKVGSRLIVYARA